MIRPRSETIAVRLPRSSMVCAAALAAALIAVGAPARAGITFYNGFDMGATSGSGTMTPDPNSLAAGASFSAALTGVGTQNFDSPSLLNKVTFPTSLTFSSTVTATGTDADQDDFVTSADYGGAHPTSGTGYLLSDGMGMNATLTFSTPIAGIGFFLTDLANSTGPDQISLVLTLTNGTQLTETESETTTDGNNNTNVSLGNGNVIFYGVVITDPTPKIKSVEILNTTPSSNDVFGIDDMTIGTGAVVPEPASIVLMGIGVLGLAVGYSRRGRASSRPA